MDQLAHSRRGDRPAAVLVTALAAAVGCRPVEIDWLIGAPAEAIADWVATRASPDREQLARLEIVTATAEVLTPRLGPAATLEWFVRPHPGLDDHRPIDVLASPEVAGVVLEQAVTG